MGEGGRACKRIFFFLMETVHHMCHSLICDLNVCLLLTCKSDEILQVLFINLIFFDCILLCMAVNWDCTFGLTIGGERCAKDPQEPGNMDAQLIPVKCWFLKQMGLIFLGHKLHIYIFEGKHLQRWTNMKRFFGFFFHYAKEPWPCSCFNSGPIENIINL